MAEAAKLMAGKRGIVFGVANNRSIAWGITKAVPDQGAEVALTYQGDAIKKRVEPLAAEVGSKLVLPCDVTDEATVELCSRRSPRPGARSISWSMPSPSPTRSSSTGAMSTPARTISSRRCLISCYSFTALAKRAEKLMPNGGSLLTLTYYGAEKVMPHYNVMGVAKAALEASVRYLAADLGKEGIRVNAISAGPIKTLAASGIADFRYILKWNEYNSPLRRTVSIEDVGGGALYLLSDLGARRHRRDPAYRRRLPRGRHEERGRPGHLRGEGVVRAPAIRREPHVSCPPKAGPGIAGLESDRGDPSPTGPGQRQGAGPGA